MKYNLDDFVYFIGKNNPSKLFNAIYLTATLVFAGFILFFAMPSFIKLKKAHQIISEFSSLKEKGDILSSRVRSQLKEYRLKNNQIKQFMEIARFNAPNYVFDKILTLLNNSQINDVILKIGHIRTEMEKDGLTLMLVPVRIKAYVKYGKLKSFFNALNKSTVYTIDKMEIAWSNEKEKDSIEIDMTVILKYKDTGKTLERI